MAQDALAAHARDELGISEAAGARPVQAALASSASFTADAALPIATVMLMPERYLVAGIAATSLICLAALGAIAARAGGAPVLRASLRVFVWGALALAVTAGVGALFGAAA